MQKDLQETVLIGLTGDVMIGRLVNECLNNTNPKYIWGDFLPLLLKTDLNVINLETTLTYSNKLVPKVFNFKADPPKVQSLVEASVDIVNLANNHILDFSEEGLFETIQTLDQANIQHVGAGTNHLEASRAVIKNCQNIKIGILGCTDNEPMWEATEHQAGVFYLNVGDLSAIQGEILKLRPQVDILILSIHWGPNMKERPSHAFIQFAHQLIDCGADLIHGHSAHVFQGVEKYKEKLILYDTGDFIDDYYVDPFLRNDCSFFFLVEVSKKGIEKLTLIPSIISEFQVNRAKGEVASKIISRMQKLSAEFQTELVYDQENLVINFLPTR